jgi:hypothetical protein
MNALLSSNVHVNAHVAYTRCQGTHWKGALLVHLQAYLRFRTVRLPHYRNECYTFLLCVA